MSYFIYCNHVWGNTYQTNLKSLTLIQKKLVRIISCAPFKAHTEPLMFAMRLLSVNDINHYMTAIFMYQCLNCNTLNICHISLYIMLSQQLLCHNVCSIKTICIPTSLQWLCWLKIQHGSVILSLCEA